MCKSWTLNRLARLVFLHCSLSLGLLGADNAEVRFALIDAPPPPPTNSFRPWPSQLPPDCPFPQSETLVGVAFTGRHAEYTGADTWYPSWAADGNLYSPWTDGNVQRPGRLAPAAKTRPPATPRSWATIRSSWSSPTTASSSPARAPTKGRYPCGSLVHDGVWYYGTYCLHPSGGVPRDGIHLQLALDGPLRRLPLVHRLTARPGRRRPARRRNRCSANTR